MRACSKHRRRNCQAPECIAAAKPFSASKPTSQRRPQFNATRSMRERAVAEWQAQYGNWCPICGRTDAKLTADHLRPVALSGAEDGPLSVHCVDCQRSQGGKVGNEVKRMRLKGRAPQ
jgi:hypothetical protein